MFVVVETERCYQQPFGSEQQKGDHCHTMSTITRFYQQPFGSEQQKGDYCRTMSTITSPRTEIREGKSKKTSTEWSLKQILSMPVYKEFFLRFTFIASVAASLPVTNALPEREASALKNIKTRHRNRIKNGMLQALLQVSINGPPSLEAENVIKAAVKKWMKCKDHRKLDAKKSQPQVQPTRVSIAIQTEPVIVADQEEIREEIRAESE